VEENPEVTRFAGFLWLLAAINRLCANKLKSTPSKINCETEQL
jgi:hypothetical protein